jgi:putative intracellular protease/amidase
MENEKTRILMVVSNPTTSTTTGWPVGFWAAELTHAYKLFTERGYDVTIASLKGARVEIDSLSDPRDSSGYSKEDLISLQFLQQKKFNALLENTKKVSDLTANDFDAIVVVGGQGPMFTFKTETGLQNAFLEFYNKGKISAALCHGTSLLLYLKNKDNEPIIQGRKLGADSKKGNAFEAFAIRDGNLITGQQQHSGAEVAKLVIEALGK